MSLFGSIMSRIFGHPAAAAPGAAGVPGATTGATGAAATPAPTPGNMVAPAEAPAPTSALGADGMATPGQAGGQPQVDVAAVLEAMAAKYSEKLNWRTSIVDLMKLLDLDSSLANRKELAQELRYSGDMQDSAAMNIWLHKQVMQKLAENGGKVPADLRD